MKRLALVLGITWLVIGHALAAPLDDAKRLFEAQQYDQALKAVREILRENPREPEARFLKGLILVNTGKENEAVKVFRAITKDYPELPESYNNIAVIYASQGKYDEAREALLSALKTHPSYAVAHENLGDIYAKLASEAYQQALELNDRNQEVKVKLSLIQNIFPGQGAAQHDSEVAHSSAADTVLGQPVASAQPAVMTTPAKPEPATENPPAPPPEPVVTASKAGAIDRPPAPIPTPAKSAQDEIGRAAVDAVRQWAKAWSSQDVDAYVSHYSATVFQPDNGQSFAAWKAQRKVRLSKPAFIKVALSALQAEVLDDEHVSVRFTQRYESNTYSDSSRKQLDLQKSGDAWKIIREQSIQ